LVANLCVCLVVGGLWLQGLHLPLSSS